MVQGPLPQAAKLGCLQGICTHDQGPAPQSSHLYNGDNCIQLAGSPLVESQCLALHSIRRWPF